MRREGGMGENVLLHTDQLEITTKVASIQARDGQAVAEAGHGGLEVVLMKVRVEVGRAFDGGVHVGPDEGDGGAGDAAALVGDLDGDVLFALGDDDLGGREGGLARAVRLDDGAEAVLEQLEEHVAEVARHIHEGDVVGADQLHLRRLEEAVVVFAHEACVFDGFLRQLAYVAARADDADVVGFVPLALFRQRDVLAHEHADADARHVEPVEERLDVLVDLHALLFTFVFENALSWFLRNTEKKIISRHSFFPSFFSPAILLGPKAPRRKRRKKLPIVVTTPSCRRLIPSNVFANRLL